MADTKISALTAVVTPAGTDEFPVNQAGTTKKTLLSQIKTFVSTALAFAAGSASANSWPKFTSGTILTTPEAGALEYDGNLLYATQQSSNRGWWGIKHFVKTTADRTLTDTTSAQDMFSAGTITLGTGYYRFKAAYVLSAMSATSGNSKFSLTGTATVASPNIMCYGMDGGVGPSNITGGQSTSLTGLGGSQHSSATGTGQFSWVEGWFEVTVSGTIKPQIALATGGVTPTLRGGSWFEVEYLGPMSLASVGNWS